MARRDHRAGRDHILVGSYLHLDIGQHKIPVEGNGLLMMCFDEVIKKTARDRVKWRKKYYLGEFSFN
jgi:hypothetical protein